jgi:hypothetical protein
VPATQPIPKYGDRKIKSVNDLIKALQLHLTGEPVWFRGHSKEAYTLVPSISRSEPGVTAEMDYIKRFKQNAGPFLATRPTTTWDWLMLMQHHRMHTRLLDWTESPLVGLYFAVQKSPTADGCLWCLLPTKLNEHANLTYQYAPELPALGDEDSLDGYSPETISAKRLTGVNPVAVIGPRDTPRMYAQMGTFTLSHSDPIPIETVADGKHVWRYIVPAAAKKTIKQQLSLLGISTLTLFPELDNVARLNLKVDAE